MEVIAREEDVELWRAALDDDTFAKLSEADIGYTTHTAPSSMGFDPSQRQEQAATQRPRHGATTAQRFKRKNFSKQLQLLCLQRYAQYARDFGRLANKHETQQILQQSYLQFLKEGGAADEPRLTHSEFLKLIRNRRREINARAQRSPKQIKGERVAVRRMAVLTPAKRKLQEEHAKIREFIEVIDRAREQAGLIPDSQPQQRRFRIQQAALGQGHAHHHRHHHHHHQHSTTVDTVSPSPIMEGMPPLPPDPMEQLGAILRIHHETQEVQREIVARLRSISRAINQHEGHVDPEDPSSVSV